MRSHGTTTQLICVHIVGLTNGPKLVKAKGTCGVTWALLCRLGTVHPVQVFPCCAHVCALSTRRVIVEDCGLLHTCRYWIVGNLGRVLVLGHQGVLVGMQSVAM